MNIEDLIFAVPILMVIGFLIVFIQLAMVDSIVEEVCGVECSKIDGHLSGTFMNRKFVGNEVGYCLCETYDNETFDFKDLWIKVVKND